MVSQPKVSGLPDYEDVRNFVLASLLTAMAFAAAYQEFNLQAMIFYIPASALIIGVREFGVRTVINLLDGYVDLEIAQDGATATIVGAIMALISGVGFLLLFPIYSSPSRKSYENWGKSTDVIWARYKFYIASGGIVALLLGWLILFNMGMNKLAQMTALFTFFQMMPFDYSKIPTGTLDGAEIIRWSGFYFLLFLGLSIVAFFLTVI